jgi:hypothetical protein
MIGGAAVLLIRPVAKDRVVIMAPVSGAPSAIA